MHTTLERGGGRVGRMAYAQKMLQAQLQTGAEAEAGREVERNIVAAFCVLFLFSSLLGKCILCVHRSFFYSCEMLSAYHSLARCSLANLLVDG